MRTIVCVASGPSLTAEDVEYCRGKAEVLVVNDGYRIAPWANWLWACDYKWWELHEEASRGFAGERWTRDPDAASRWGLSWIRSAPEPGLSRDPSLIHEGENGGFQGINFVFHKNPDRILLLAYDMQGLGHWFGEHRNGLQDATDFSERQHHFDALAEDLKAEGVEVINCSRETGLKCFPRARIQEVL